MIETLPHFRESKRAHYDEMIDTSESLRNHFVRPAFDHNIARTAFEVLAAESVQNPEGVGYTMLKSTPQDDGSIRTDEDDY